MTLETMAVEKELTAESRGHVVRNQDHRSSPLWGENPDVNYHVGRGGMGAKLGVGAC